MNRVVLVVLFGLLANVSNAVFAQNLNAPSAITSQELLQATTKAWFSIPDSQKLDEKFLETQLGKLSQDEKLAPFIDSLKEQFNEWLNEKNVRLGLNVRDVEDVRSGEICIAGILPNQVPGANKKKLGRGSHGLVLLVDVSENVEDANELLIKLSKDLTERGATKEPYKDLNGAKVSKWKFPKKSRLKNNRFAFHTITNGWLLSSDNETIFREIVRRLVNIDNVQPGETLAAQPAFQTIMERVKLKDHEDPEVFWFVNPFGYIQLAQAIAAEEREIRQPEGDDSARILQKIGFDGFKAVGGTVKLATGNHEILHRTFVYKPLNPKDVKQKRVFDMFDFANKKGADLHPPLFVPETISSFVRGTWNMQAALKNIGYAIDTFARSDGTFEDTLDQLRVEMNVDVRKVVSKFDNEIMVISDVARPIKEDSERLIVAVNTKGERQFIIKSIEDSWPHQHREEMYREYKIVEIDDSIGDEDVELEMEDDPFRDPSADWEDDEEEEEVEPSFSLFERRFCSTNDNFLFVANNDEYLKTVLNGPCDNPLVKSPDYMRVVDSLNEISDPSNISFRQFTRLDLALRTNYEMMRSGKMAASNTILARFLNHVFDSQKKNPEDVRKQKIDGSTLPSDYDNDVAPYLGPAGWVMETSKDGWLFTGVLLEKNEAASQVVKKEVTTQRK